MADFATFTQQGLNLVCCLWNSWQILIQIEEKEFIFNFIIIHLLLLLFSSYEAPNLFNRSFLNANWIILSDLSRSQFNALHQDVTLVEAKYFSLHHLRMLINCHYLFENFLIVRNVRLDQMCFIHYQFSMHLEAVLFWKMFHLSWEISIIPTF